ncbi:MAG TPA: metallophosphoesterase [Bacteroidota bacterium]|nr:metallophosphoesterase [Bacteroidota bacterium]
MRILAFTDIHGAYDRVVSILSSESFDALVIGGDLTTHGSIQEASVALRRFQEFGKPVFAVAGNMDLPSFEDSYNALGVNINAKGASIRELGLFGVAGSPVTPMNTPYELSEEEILQRAEAGWSDVSALRWKIFVPHAPPHGTKLDRIFVGKHVGSTAVRRFVEHRQPDVLICGHIHEARGMDTIGNTQMVNCGPAGRGSYASIEFDTSIHITLHG